MIQKRLTPGDPEIRKKKIAWNVTVSLIVPRFNEMKIEEIEWREWKFSVILN